jgi:glycosyltransferase involved in cell wall biosynthesis
MRLLYLTGSPARYMAPPVLAEEQINAGPDWADETAADGRVRSLATPVGEYELGDVLARLPADQRPDAVVAVVDASWRHVPRRVDAFRGPKVLLIADTHHLRSPLLGMLRYIAEERYDRHVLLYDRHHAALFASAGIGSLFWQPGLTFPHDDAVVHAARRARRAARIAFVGQAGRFHPRRLRLLEALEARRLAVESRAVGQREGLAFYGASLLGFNASLNGDLNLRALEILAGGAALLTDRLAPDAGLGLLGADGRELLAYGDAAELAELAERALADPAGTAAVGAAGAACFDRHWSAARRRGRFEAMLRDGRAEPAFALPEPGPAVFFPGDTDRLLGAAMVYEGLQELHRTQETVQVALGAGVPDDFAALCRTLPRVAVGPADAVAAPDLLAFSRTAAEVATTTAADRLWCCDALPGDFPVLAEALAPAGYRLVSEAVAVLCREAAPAAAAAPRVLLLTDDPDSGGVAQYNHSLLLGLAADGLAVACAQSRADNPLVAAQRAAGVEHHWIPYDTRGGFARTLTDRATAERIVAAARPDLVVFSDCCPVSNLAARQVALERGIPFVVVVGFVGAYLADRVRAVLPALAAQYAAARAVVAVSEENLALLRGRFGLAAGAGEVIHYGRPERFFAPADPAVRARLRAGLGLAEDAVVAFTAARLSPVKGYAYQLEAARRLAAEPAAARLHFVWAGEGEQRGELEAAIAAAGLGGRVHLLGHRWDVEAWYDAADLFVLPSDLEGMPLAIMEAMAKGLPVAATAVSGIPEELGPTGRLLPPAAAGRDALVRALAGVLLEWTRDPAARAAAGAAGRARARELFREERMVARTVALVRAHAAAPAAALRASA